MPKPICVKCKVEFKIEKTGVNIVEMFQNNKEIYKIWSADKWKCPLCDIEIVYGFGVMPLIQNGEDTKAYLQELINNHATIIFDYECPNTKMKFEE
jgi:hypothetical protein